MNLANIYWEEINSKDFKGTLKEIESKTELKKIAEQII
jgi:hypothetical protein